MRIVRRQHQIRRGLPILQLEGRQLVLFLFVFRLFLLLLLLADRVQQLLFFITNELLAVGQTRIGLFRRDVGQLLDECGATAVGRNDEEIPIAHVGESRIAARPAGTALAVRSARDLTPYAIRVEEDDISLVDEGHAPMRLVPPAIGGWRGFLLLLGQARRRPAVAADCIG